MKKEESEMKKCAVTGKIGMANTWYSVKNKLFL
jgi:hypothetical protein